MGRWDPGNFDDDLARDYLADIIHRFERFIERILSGDMPEVAEGMNIVDAGESYLVPTVEVICVLGEGLGNACEYLPTPETVARWAEEYPRQVESLMKGADADGLSFFIEERRPVIRSTFERLMRLSRAVHDATGPALGVD